MLSRLLFWRQHNETNIEKFQRQGVKFLSPETTYIGDDVRCIGPGTTILANTIITGHLMIMKNCTIGPNAYIHGETFVYPNCTIGFSADIEDSVIGPECIIEHAQIKRSKLEARVTAKHFCYIGDADVGEGSNIASGVITCNYDGARKHKTKIGKKVFVGSGCLLIAPVEIGDGAYIAAGSVIDEDVPANALAIRRAREQYHALDRIKVDETGWHILKKPTTQ